MICLPYVDNVMVVVVSIIKKQSS